MNDNDIHDNSDYDQLLVELAMLHLDEPTITYDDTETFDALDNFMELMEEYRRCMKEIK